MQQLEHALRHLVRLGQHGLGGLDQDVVLGVRHHLFSHIGVADRGFSILDVLLHYRQVVDGVVQTVLGGAQGTTDIGNHIDGVLDDVDRSLCAFLGADIEVPAIPRDAGVHILNRDSSAGCSLSRGVADLQGQATAAGRQLGIAFIDDIMLRDAQSQWGQRLWQLQASMPVTR